MGMRYKLIISRANTASNKHIHALHTNVRSLLRVFDPLDSHTKRSRTSCGQFTQTNNTDAITQLGNQELAVADTINNNN